MSMLLFQQSAEAVVDGFEQGEQEPVRAWEARRDEKAPDRNQGARILRMI